MSNTNRPAETLLNRLRRDTIGYGVAASVLDDLIGARELLETAAFSVPTDAIKSALAAVVAAVDDHCLNIVRDMERDDREGEAALRGDIHATGDVTQAVRQ